MFAAATAHPPVTTNVTLSDRMETAESLILEKAMQHTLHCVLLQDSSPAAHKVQPLYISKVNTVRFPPPQPNVTSQTPVTTHAAATSDDSHVSLQHQGQLGGPPSRTNL